MKTYKQLHEKSIRMGKMRSDEYSISDFLDDINELGRML
jgi:hypothetical protein